MDDGTGTRSGRRAALWVAGAGYFFVLLDVTIVNVALASMGGDLNATRSQLQWVVDAYALVLATFMLGAGDLADRVGSRRLFIAGLALFGFGSGACAAAPDAGFLVAARAVQGLGAAAILPTSLALVNEMHPDPAARPRAIGIWAGIGSSALVAGPVLGGVLVGPLGWRAIFWLNLPLSAAALGLAIVLLPRAAGARGHRLDLTGQALGTTALAAVVLALIEAGRNGAGSTTALAAAATGLLAAALFLIVESRRARPMLVPRWFRRAPFSGANAGAALMNLGTLGALFAISLFLQQDRGMSPLGTGLNLLPLAAPLALLTPFTGRLAAASGARRPAGLGLVLCGSGYLALALSGTALSQPAGILTLAASGIGLALATPALVAAATEALGEGRTGIASAINNTSRQVGGAVGVALIGGFSTVGASLEASGIALLLGGASALALV